MAGKDRKWLAIGAAALGTAAAAKGVSSVLKQGNRPGFGGDGPRVVILGAGFAGLTAARKLGARLGGSVRITLIDRHNYHLFTPMLYQTATLGVDPYNVAYPVRQFTGRHGVRFLRGVVKGVDFEKRTVHLEDGDVDYDYLVVALGTTTNFFGNSAAQEHAYPLKWLEDGIRIRNHVLDMLEQASTTPAGDERKTLLTFVVVGGGATGVETAAAMASLLHEVLPKDYPALRDEQARVLVIESEGKLLGHMGQRMSSIALDRLRDLGIEIWLNTKAKDVETHKVSTDDGRTVESRTILWTTGVRAPGVVADMQAEHGKGGSLAVDEYLQVCGLTGVYAIGDDSHFEDPKTHKSVPLLAATAVQEGETAAENIALAIEGKPQVPFHYRDLGNVVSLGPYSGVAQFGPVVLSGVPGWLAWRLVHLAKITSFRNQLATALDWTIGYVYDLDTARLEMEPATYSPSRQTQAAAGKGK
jgi:NADH dehydrogenase